MLKRNDYLIRKKIYVYLIPSIIMTIAMQLGNIVDSILVGNMISTEGIAAISLCSPVLYLTQMPGILLGIGGSTYASVLLGKRKTKKADSVFTGTILIGLVISFLVAFASGVISMPLAEILSGGSGLRQMTYEYLKVYLMGIPVITLVLILPYYFTVDNHPQYTSICFVISNVVNLILDYLLLKYTSMGMLGAALSTNIGYACGLLMAVPYLLSKNRMLHFTKICRNQIEDWKEAVITGAPSLMLSVCSMVKALVINSFIVRRFNSDVMTVYAICENAILITEMFVGGIIEVIPTIGGILFGEEDYFGIRVLGKKVLKLCGISVVLVCAVLMIQPQAIAGLFGADGGNVSQLSKSALRIFACSIPFYVWNKYTQTYYQTILQTKLSAFITMLQGFFIIVPATILLAVTRGENGIWLAAVINEIVTILIIAGFVRWGQKKGRYTQGDYYLIPMNSDEDVLDVSIANSMEEMEELMDMVMEYCDQQKISNQKSYFIVLAVEEMVSNIITYGYNKEKYNTIDVRLNATENHLLLSIRDNGVPFDPTTYERKEEMEGADARGIGITLIKKISLEMNYMRILNFNHTVFKFDRNELKETG